MDQAKSQPMDNTENQSRTAESTLYLDETIVEMMAAYSEQVDLQAGEYLFRQGDASDAMYVVLSGGLLALLTTDEDEEQIVGEIGPGGVVGEMQILSGKPRVASIKADENTILGKVGRPAFDKIARQNPRFLIKIGKIIEQRLQRDQLFEALPKLFGQLDLETMRQIQSRLEWVFLSRGQPLARNQRPL